MDVVLFLAAMPIAYYATSRSLGQGFVVVLAFGYFNGLLRANYLGVFSTLVFDSAVLGMYAAFFTSPKYRAGELSSTRLGAFVACLIAWPAALALVPVNHYLIQLVALRSCIWYLPILLVAWRLGAADLVWIARGFAVLDCTALFFALYEYANGIQSLFPLNPVTELMYRSGDVAGGHYRIPSTFLGAHGYGGAMLASLPLLFERGFGKEVPFRDRVLAMTGTAAAIAGMLLCGARQPFTQLAITLVLLAVFSGISMRIVVPIFLVGALALYLSSGEERLQRSISALEDPEMVANRIAGSVNAGFFDLLQQYPFGAGLGSAAGTSIPFFLAEYAPTSIGMENEYARILVEQGWLGLVGWASLLLWLYVQPPPLRVNRRWSLFLSMAYFNSLVTWFAASGGTGILAAVPGTALAFMYVGCLARVRENRVKQRL